MRLKSCEIDIQELFPCSKDKNWCWSGSNVTRRIGGVLFCVSKKSKFFLDILP